jgi:hypothetical protein
MVLLSTNCRSSDHTDADSSTFANGILQTHILRFLLRLERLRQPDELATVVFERDPCEFYSTAEQGRHEDVRGPSFQCYDSSWYVKFGRPSGSARQEALRRRQTPFSLGSAQICFLRLAQHPAVITVAIGSMNNFSRHVLPYRSPELL